MAVRREKPDASARPEMPVQFDKDDQIEDYSEEIQGEPEPERAMNEKI